MKLAWRELNYYKKKYLLIETIIVLMIFMVLFLVGLANGLGRAVSSGIEDMDANYYVLSDTAENLITVSNLEPEVYDQVQNMTSDTTTSLDIQRMYVSKLGETEKLDVTYFAIEAGSFLEPNVYEGTTLSGANDANPIILDDDYEGEGIKLGDTILDSSTNIEFTVVGFTKDKMYGHTSIGYITSASYSALRTELNPNYQASIHAIAVQGNDVDDIAVAGTEVVDKATIIKNLPGYQAEQMTIQMIVWILVLVSAAIMGVFCYILTLQKERQFGVMKAIGVGMRDIVRMICSQVFIMATFGAIVANVLNYGMAAALPSKMPYYLVMKDACIITIVFIAISVISSLLSVSKVAKVDPVRAIGGIE